MKNKGFTLIELLAVIIILGILMIIAIPSVTSYINNSRKSTYIDTAKQLISGARNLVNKGNLRMYDTNTTYYIDSSCIKTEGGEAESPFGKFNKAYVVVTFNGNGYDYYWTSVDETGEGIKDIVDVDKLNEDNIESDLKISDIKDTIGVDGRSQYMIINKNTNCGIGEVINVTGYVEDKYITFPEGKDRSTLSYRDIVTIGTEDFYFIRYDGNNLVLLAKYNLKVGDIYQWEGHNVVKIDSYTSNNEGYGIQSSEATGFKSEGVIKGTIPFAENNYWKDNYSSNKYVYGPDSNLYNYVENYKKYLSGFNVHIKEARLLNELEHQSEARVEGLYYWTGVTGTTDITICCTQSGGATGYTGYRAYFMCGVRPVIVI